MRFPVPGFLLSLLILARPVSGQGMVRAHHLDVGQGSATLIEGPGGQTCLVDAGDFGQGYAAVLPLLWARGITFLDAVVLTHYHTDHWGGIPELVSSGIGIGAAYDRGNAAMPGGIGSYLAAVGATRTAIVPGTVIDLGGGATLTCICVNGQVLGGAQVSPASGSQEENARSIGLRLRFGNYHEAIAGDLTGGGGGTADVESVAGPAMGDVDVMAVNHHGSSTSTSIAWMAALAPEVSICSSGDGNAYGHPHAQPVANILSWPTTAAFFRLEAGSATPGGVVVNGTLLVETDGSSYTVSGGAVAPWTFTVDEGAQNSIPAPPLYVPGDVVVSEYMSNPQVVPDADGEWLELANTTPQPLDLAGFMVRDQGSDAFTLPSVVIPARGLVVLARSGNTAQNGGVVADYVWPSGSFALGNGYDEIEVVDPMGQVLDAVVYDDGATFPDPDGASVERRDLGAVPRAQNFGVAAPTFGLGDRGTPGAANSQDATPPAVPLTVAGPLQPGTQATLALDAGIALGGRPYLLALSTCAAPGFLLPASGRLVDLCPSPLLIYSLSFPNAGPLSGFAGNLGIFGLAAGTLQIPPDPGLSGLVVAAAGVVLDGAAPDGVGAVSDHVFLVVP